MLQTTNASKNDKRMYKRINITKVEKNMKRRKLKTILAVEILPSFAVNICVLLFIILQYFP